MADRQPRKRRRVAKSCDQCRQRKVRCDRNIPCGPCTRARASLNCSYCHESSVDRPVSDTRIPIPQNAVPARSVSTTASNGGEADSRSTTERTRGDSHPRLHSPPPGQQSIQDLRRRLQSLENQISDRESHNAPVTHEPTLEQALRDLTTKVQRIEQRLSPPTGPAEVCQAGDLSISPIWPRLLGPGSKMKLLGPTHWNHGMDRVQFDPFHNTKDPDPTFQEAKVELASIVKECRGLRQSIKSKQSERLNDPIPDLRSTIPDKAVCDDLVYYYLRTFESIYRVIHVPSFWKEYGEFWEQPQAAARPFLMKLVLILATGVVFYPHQGNFTDHPYLELARKWIFAAQSWLTGPSEKSTVSLDGLQVFCLLLLARQACGLGPSPWLSSGSLLKMAMAMGLHWNPASFPSLSVFHSEMRARLWATVLELIVQSSLDSGTPISLPENFDDKGPKNIDDQNISPDSSTAPVPQRNDQVTDTSIQILLRRSLKLRIDVIRVIGDRSGQSYRTVLQLGAELRNVCRELASFFNSNMPGYSFPQLRPTNFHRIFLDTQIRRYILFLYKPFMVQARWEPRYYYARKTCLESATIIASYADRVDLPNGELDDLSRLFILGKGPFKGPLSLDILSVIGFEIINQLEEEAPAQPSTLPAADPLDELSKANRAPLIRRLEHIRDQLRQIIALGTPSMKRYNLFAAMIGQIQAMESGQSVKSAVYETLRHTLKDSHALLEANTSPAQGSIHALVGGPNDNPPDSLTGLDMNLVDPTLDVDLSSLLYVPGLFDINDLSF